MFQILLSKSPVPLFLLRNTRGKHGWRRVSYSLLFGCMFSYAANAEVIVTGVQGIQNSTVLSTGNRNPTLSNNLIAADINPLISTTKTNTDSNMNTVKQWGNTERTRLNLDLNTGALMQGQACYYADQRYSEGALVDVGKQILRCSKQQPEFNNSPLEWQLFNVTSGKQ
ncbi:MAG: DUF1496 domain-containing protein [Plesiomonas sp.]|uniref:DUF1496 domain-containing protein n=1 Tax=Plesiomonas sp. TaxID=2486279 RepID=UPI003F3C0F70